MTALPIHRIPKPSRVWGKIEPMSKVDERAWRITRERHPHLYQKGKGR
jgi:hypothetical protein